MTHPIHWLSVPEFADALGTTSTAVREMIRERYIVAVRRGERQSLQIPADFIEPRDGGARVIPTLRGTLTMLADAKMTDEETVDWLTSVSPELDEAPLTALRDGKRAPVRRAAQTLM